VIKKKVCVIAQIKVHCEVTGDGLQRSIYVSSTSQMTGDLLHLLCIPLFVLLLSIALKS